MLVDQLVHLVLKNMSILDKNIDLYAGECTDILVIFVVVVRGVGLVLLTTTMKTGTKAGAN